MIDPNARHARYVILGLLLIAQMGASLIQQGLGALAPFFVSALDLDKAQLGTVFTALSLGSAIFLTPAGIRKIAEPSESAVKTVPSCALSRSSAETKNGASAPRPC